MDTWRFKSSYFWQKAPFFRYLPPLVLSIICYDAPLFADISVAPPLVCCLVCVVIFATLAFYRSTATAKDYILFIALQLTIFFLGISLCILNDATRKTTWLGKNINSTSTYVATVDGSPAVKAKTIKLLLKIKGKIEQGRVTPLTGKAILYIYKNNWQSAFTLGATILVPGKWEPIANRPSPFGFNYAGYCARNDIYHQQFAARKDIFPLTAIPVNENFLQKTHRICMERLQQHVRDQPTRGLLQAMITGDEVNLDPEMRTQYAQTGIVHIIAISGSHVANLFFLLSLCLFWIKKEKHQWIKQVAGILLIWLYVLMAGAPPSAVRSAIMFSSIALGFILGKDRNTLNNLFVAAFITLLWQPMWLFSVGFQLSFVAVLSLVLFYGPISSLIKPTNKIARVIWNIIASSIAVELLIAPLVIYYFHMLPIVSVLANLAAWGLTAFALVMGTLIIILSSFTGIADEIGSITTSCIHFFNNILAFIQQFNPRSFFYFQISTIELLLLYVLICLAAIVLLQKRWRLVFPFLFVCCIALILFVKDKNTAFQQDRLAIFYHQGKGSITHVKGYHFETSDTALLTDYNGKAALTGWHAWQQSQSPLQPGYLIHLQKIVFADDTRMIDSNATFPIDILVFTGTLKSQSFDVIKKVYTPKRIIAADKQSDKQITQWRKNCRQNNILFSAAQEDGTIIIE